MADMMMNEGADAGEVQVESSSPSQEAAAPAQEAPKQEANPQFIPYERFKEINDTKNEFQRRFEEQEKKLQEFQSRLSESSKQQEAVKSKEQALVERLKGIDPEFGSWAEQQEAARKELSELKAWRAQAEQQRIQTEARSTLDKLHSDHKVAPEARRMYDAMIANIATQNPHLGPKDLPSVYKTVHDEVSKFLEATKRATIAEYSSGKKQDSSVPSQAKGVAPKAASKPQAFSSDPEEARMQVVQRAIERARAHRASS